MSHDSSTVVLAGATGNLGGRIARALRARGAAVRALVREDSAPDAVAALHRAGIEPFVVRYDDADGRMDFTTIDDTASYTAAAALDATTPRTLRISGDQVSARELTDIISRVTETPWQLTRAGGLGRLRAIVSPEHRGM